MFASLSSERVLVELKEIHLKINGKQTVKLKSGFTEFKKLFQPNTGSI